MFVYGEGVWTLFSQKLSLDSLNCWIFKRKKNFSRPILSPFAAHGAKKREIRVFSK